jgi:hypothetical protein
MDNTKELKETLEKMERKFKSALKDGLYYFIPI